jgi:hypothetical protein
MIEAIRAQLLKRLFGAMVDVDMSLTPLRVIGKEVCLRAKGLYGLSKDLGPKRHPNTLWREKSKEIRDFTKVEIMKDTMGVARNNELKFQRPLEHHQF